MAIQVGAFEAKTHLSRLLAAVQRGEHVTITRRGRPIAVLVPPEEALAAGFSEVAAELASLRERTQPQSESLQALRREGRRF